MRLIGMVILIAAAIGAVALAAPEDKQPPEKPDYRELVEKLGAWVKDQEDAENLAGEDLKEIQALVTALEKLGAKELYDGLSPEQRKALRELLDKEERLEGYASRVDRIAEDVGLNMEDSETLLDLYTVYREEARAAGWNDREKRDAASDTFEKKLAKELGRTKARAIANAIRRTSRRGGR